MCGREVESERRLILDPECRKACVRVKVSVPACCFIRQEGVLVPHIVRSCTEDVERRGLEEVGIYRISGAASDIQALKATFDTSELCVCVCLCVCNITL